MKADTALNGLQAYNKVKLSLTKTCCTVKYNYILMDIRMPIMDGFSASEKILGFQNEMKKSKGLAKLVQDLKIFAVTSYLNADTEQRA